MSVPIKFVPAEFGSRVDPDLTKKGKIACCGCGCHTFLIFVLEGQNHPHLECADCGTSYCMGGENCEGENRKEKNK